MKHSKIPLSQTIVALCKAHNITHIVISPGSRNAPLTIGFTHNNDFKCYSIVDERCAAFFALGMAQQLLQPVAVVCTSGSALLNYYPAVSEAFYSRIPLVVISADRPEYLLDIGDGQTVKQKNVYGDHVFYNANLKLDLQSSDKVDTLNLQNEINKYNTSEINLAFNKARLESGPVHINCPFNEPLYEIINELSVNIAPNIEEKLNINGFDEDLTNYINQWDKATRKLILVGVNSPNTIEQQWIDAFANDNSVIVFTETTSNIHHESFFPGIDKIIAPLEDEDFLKLQPEILLTFGGLVVSKKIKAFLRKYQPKQHWHIDPYSANDTFFCLKHHFKVTPNQFFSQFIPKLSKVVESNYNPYWSTVKSKRRKKHENYLETIPFSDFKVFNRLLQSLPNDSQLQVGNSSAIRYTQLFQMPNDVTVFCNRGTSGIDGSTSTAIGAALASGKRTTFITGDLSFFYDSNALWNNYIPNSFRIIVINNSGGGIFRILPGHKNTENFDTYFETKHQLTASHLCDMYGFYYSKASNDSELKTELSKFYNDENQPKLLEIFTPSEINDEVLLNYFKFIK
ncbi:2-succinyl-5-enolpyruvyl-6-hydroxy-3-cyclohexene-1-carboxylic-acid synthase [Winogradskyella immobilis]|uniref:2-succinyl-5-enolpyruvyl-6-hydroxy-3-cyclohexene-1-carboxylate synthase n=1 Tax=Winogradskyella immobilis TaxID=2816852 RepID=A0ABS8EMA4_9FLAO|nr:2-succinyl-5-enolpyruvyl-6-hydroxy-3-cyclohexene-1-carboxylic-acid synthase [Winogradskyella immobilis]MCC1483695.1 2-succinyl-5-enolpyruvyl-6-hydroxy-3-cyclohexene-1-carboxylic-acid synthase [Winogradskyella immobilis]MCG0015789.1 2-succinyl-5-enolpyruvyl-6-hydroxy-3-cyclohexene-1-carboxylic-acid synthase [Winogradskyella immobilis]